VYTTSIGNVMSSICDTANSGAVLMTDASDASTIGVNLRRGAVTAGCRDPIRCETTLSRGAFNQSVSSSSSCQNSIPQAQSTPSTRVPPGSQAVSKTSTTVESRTTSAQPALPMAVRPDRGDALRT